MLLSRDMNGIIMSPIIPKNQQTRKTTVVISR